MLPLSSAPNNVRQIVDTSDVSPRSPMAALLFNCGYDSALWLLRAIERARLPQMPFSGPLVEHFELDDSARALVAPVDNASMEYDSLATFVALLRSTLFCMPFEGNDFALVQRCGPQQRITERVPDYLGEHYNDSARRFLEQVESLMSRDQALMLIDTLSFDMVYADCDDWRHAETTASIIALRSLDDDSKPRFAERLSQCGIAEVYQQVFGALTTCPDERATITTNLARLPLPSTPGRWMTTRPTVDPRVQLATRPISALPTRQESAREIARAASSSSSAVATGRQTPRGRPTHALFYNKRAREALPLPTPTVEPSTPSSEPKLDYEESEASVTECEELEQLGAYSKRLARSDTSEASFSEDTPSAFNRLSLMSRASSSSVPGTPDIWSREE